MPKRKKCKISEQEFVEHCIDAIVNAWTGDVDAAVKMYESEEYIDFFENHIFWDLAVNWSINKLNIFITILGIVFVVWLIFYFLHGLFIGFDVLTDEIATRL